MSVVNVQNRVASAQGLLPAEVTKSGITVRKRQSNTLKAISLYSPDDSYDSNFLTNYLKINIEPQLSRIAGVGDVNIWGASYSMRIWLDPQRMAQYGLMPSDIRAVLDEQNIESPTGTLGAESKSTFRYVLKYRGRYENEEDYANMVIKSLPDGSVLRLGDVAKVELGAENYNMLSQTNGHPGANCMTAQTSGSNANETIEEMNRVQADLAASLPKGMVLTDITSTKDFLDASISNVVETLVVAILLVVLVVYLFLHDLRATLIPSLAIIVSLLGTFAFLYAVGFSLNLLTLFALVLVIGTVVDDSIVVVEAVQARFDEGCRSAYQATVEAMSGLTSALMTTTIVFMAVFIPVSFMGGTTGTFYTQCRSCHLAAQRADAQSRPVCPHPPPACWPVGRPQTRLLRPVPLRLQPFFPPRAPEIYGWCLVPLPPQGRCLRQSRSGVCRPRRAAEHDEDRPRAAGGHGNHQRQRPNRRRNESRRDGPHHGRD